MNLSEQRVGGVTVVEVVGRVDSAHAPQLHDRVGALLTAGHTAILVDFGQVEYISSAGFRVLLLLARQARQGGSRFALCALNAKVKRLFDLGGFLDLLPISQTREEGLAATQ